MEGYESKLKEALDATRVDYVSADDTYTTYNVSGKGYVVVAVVERMTNECFLVSPFSGRTLKQLQL